MSRLATSMVLAVLVAGASSATPQAASDTPTTSPAPLSHVRADDARAVPALASAPTRLLALDQTAASLLRSGTERSVTFRRLVDVIEHSDLIVLVQAYRANLQHPGLIQFTANTPCARYVRVAIRVPGLENDLIATLAHELQRAVEIAGAPEVRDHATLLRFYQRIGRGGQRGLAVEMETAGAQRTGTLVLNKLMGLVPKAARR